MRKKTSTAAATSLVFFAKMRRGRSFERSETIRRFCFLVDKGDRGDFQEKLFFRRCSWFLFFSSRDVSSSSSGRLGPQPRGHLGVHEPPADARPRVRIGLAARVENRRRERRAAGALGAVERERVGSRAGLRGKGEQRRRRGRQRRGLRREGQRRQKGGGSPLVLQQLLLLLPL